MKADFQNLAARFRAAATAEEVKHAAARAAELLIAAFASGIENPIAQWEPPTIRARDPQRTEKLELYFMGWIGAAEHVLPGWPTNPLAFEYERAGGTVWCGQSGGWESRRWTAADACDFFAGWIARGDAVARDAELYADRQRGLELWNAGATWPHVAERVRGDREIWRAVAAEVRRHAQDTKQAIRTGKPGSKRKEPT